MKIIIEPSAKATYLYDVWLMEDDGRVKIPNVHDISAKSGMVLGVLKTALTIVFEGRLDIDTEKS